MKASPVVPVAEMKVERPDMGLSWSEPAGRSITE
jgi:hypothetical protein